MEEESKRTENKRNVFPEQKWNAQQQLNTFSFVPVGEDLRLHKKPCFAETPTSATEKGLFANRDKDV